MAKRIYRSLHVVGENGSQLPSKYVEVVIDDDDYEVLHYDVGFEPPYYDIVSLPKIVFEFGGISKPPYTIEAFTKRLKSMSIHVDEWEEVEHCFLHESNAIIRPDIREDVRPIFGFTEHLPPPIPLQVGVEAIKQMLRFDGSSAILKLQFLEPVVDYQSHPFLLFDPLTSIKGAEGAPSEHTKFEFRTFVGNFYMMFREPAKHHHWGLIGKGSMDNVSVGVIAEGDFHCKLYDQTRRVDLMKGLIAHLQIEFFPARKRFVITAQGLSERTF